MAVSSNVRVAARTKPLELEVGASRRTAQNMLDELYSQGGGTLYVPPGLWRFGDDNLTTNGPVSIEGSGEEASTFQWTGGGLVINGGLGVETLRAGVRYLTLDGSNSVTGAQHGLTLGDKDASNFKTGSGLFQSVTVKRFSIAGVVAEYTAMATWMRCTFESNRDGYWAPYVVQNSHTVATFLGCRFASNRKRGAFIEQGDSIVFGAGTQIEDNGEEGVYLLRPSGADPVMRNITLDLAYIEDNGTAGAFADVRFETAGTESNQNIAVRRCRIQGTNPDGNIWWGKTAGGLEEDNEFSPIGITNNIASNSAVCFVHSRNARLPSTMWTLGANAPTTHERRGGDGTVRMYWNDNGTMRIYGTRSTTAATVTHTIKDEMVHCSANAAAVTVNLVSAATVGRGYKCTFVKTDASANAVTLDGSGSETINGSATHALSSQYAKATICSDGTNWLIV